MKQMNVIIIFSKSSIFFIAQLRALESQLPACIPIRFTKKKTEVQKCKVWKSLLTGRQYIIPWLEGRLGEDVFGWMTKAWTQNILLFQQHIQEQPTG